MQQKNDAYKCYIKITKIVYLFEEFRFLQTKLDLLIIIIINTLFEVGKLTYLFQKYTV